MTYVVISRDGCGSRAVPINDSIEHVIHELSMLERAKRSERYTLTLELRDFAKAEIAAMEPFGGW